jgi:hypothetical protein
MSGTSRTVIGIAVVGTLLVLAALLAPWGGSALPAVEVAVVFPGTSDTNWVNFVEGVRLAAEEAGTSVESRDLYECQVVLDGFLVRFRWCPDVGIRNLQRRVHELCQRPNSPIAVVGANNSSLTWVLAEELAACGDSPRTPLLLMTTATADALMDVHRGRSFRFGFNNSFQAKTVVGELQRYLRQLGRPLESPATVGVLVVQVLDDPFSTDLARCFAEELRLQLAAELVPPPADVPMPTGPMTSPGSKLADVWSLTTSTGSFDSPNAEEERLARKLVTAMASDPGRDWVLVLPIGTTPFRRFSYALHQAFNDPTVGASARKAKERLTIVSGDSLSYAGFADRRASLLLPDETPATTIFFAHANPIDPSVPAPQARNIPTQALDREVARALLSALRKLGPRATPTGLAEALRDYVTPEMDQPYFRDGERTAGGGAVVAIPKPGEQRFELLLPLAWAE